MSVRHCRIDEIAAIALDEVGMSVTVVPELGGKICSIVWHGRELLARNPLHPARYGVPYADFDASGFDECLPTIGECPHPDEPWNGIPIPDHGEVWSIPWLFEVEENGLRLIVHGIRFPYAFEKFLELRPPDSVRLKYALTNLGTSPFSFLWSAHPLLAPSPGMRVHLPSNTRVCVDWSKDGRLGEFLTEHPWPLTHDRDGNDVDLGLILSRDVGYVDKLYTNRLTDGWCAVHDPADDFYVAMLFPVESVPYVGLSINLGGWPVDRPAYYNLGLEPCNGYPDCLDVAAVKGSCAVAAPGERLAWHIDLHMGRCSDLALQIPRLREASISV